MAAIKTLPFNSQQAAFCLDLQRLQLKQDAEGGKSELQGLMALRWDNFEKKWIFLLYCILYSIPSYLSWYSEPSMIFRTSGIGLGNGNGNRWDRFLVLRKRSIRWKRSEQMFFNATCNDFLSCQRMFSWCFFKKHEIIWHNFLYLLHSCPQCERLNCDSCLTGLTSATLLTGYKQASTYQLHCFKQEMLLYDGQYIECPSQTLGIVAPGSLCFMTVSVV